MDIKALSDFLCLAETRNFGRAAQMRNVTVSGLSRRIKSLENWVGAELIDRGATPIALTEAGEEFRVLAAEIIGHLRAAETGGRLRFLPTLFPPKALTPDKSGRRTVPQPEHASITDSRPTLAIKPFHSLSRRQLDMDYSRSLTDALTMHMAQSPFIEPLPSDHDCEYLIDGSLICDDLSGHVTLQVTRASTARMILSRRYKLKVARFAAEMDDIAADFAWTISTKLRAQVYAEARRRPARDRTNLQNYIFVHEAVIAPGTRSASIDDAIAQLRQRECDTWWTDHIAAYAELMRWAMSPNDPARLLSARAHADAATAANPDFHPTQIATALIACLMRDFDLAEHALDRALELAPNDTMNTLPAGIVNLALGRSETALDLIRKARKFEHGLLSYSSIFAAVALYQMGRYREAATEIDLRRSPFPDAIAIRLAALAQANALEDALALKAASNYLLPSHWKVFHLERFPFADPVATENLRTGLQKAGIETAP
ncbi:MAG: LysR family transcriptional regulator [Limimaricola sp.]|uniref:LysR family transcriptional regulator n=1 Tax=Limimaricola sp. TaxID=2211665 RepID=UPI001DDB4434|nr:LysR family transcriptional regulator [Limimaricola sp.]MBI1416844.1 LysR family transcriptional regulator [Limimaricola sp.]